MRAIRILLVLLMSLPVSGRRPDRTFAAEVPITPSESAIAIRTLPPARVVYREQVGPYWSLGPVFRLMRERMATESGQGPMFIRFLENPRAVPAHTLRAQVGFYLTDRETTVTPPDVLEDRPEELAAVLEVPGHFVHTARQYARMAAWAQEQGFEPAGPMTEVYRVTASQDQPGDGVEIQLSLRVRDAEPSVPAQSDVPSMPPTDKLEQRPSGASPQAEIEAPPASPRPESTDRELPPAPDTNDMEAAPLHAESACEISGILASEDFTRVAARLMLDGDPRPAASHAFLEQVILRIRVAARGVEKAHPGEGARLSALALALDQRLQESLPASLRVESSYMVEANETLAQVRRRILREMNAMLASITHRRLHEEEVLRQLSSILEQACNASRFSGN